MYLNYFISDKSLVFSLFLLVLAVPTSPQDIQNIQNLQNFTLPDPIVKVINSRIAKSFSIGTCTWITDRKCPDNDVKFYLYTRQNQYDRQLVHIDETWEKSNLSTSHFNPFDPIKIIIHGYNSDMNLRSLVSMKDEYLVKDDFNIFYVDWSVLGPAPCYIMAVNNIQHVGKCAAQLIERILDIGNRNIHVIGFSLGAHVTNFIAQNLNDFKLPRISGLDPAMPLFISAPNDRKLDPSDAEFVDVIHTNAFVQGKIERCGHVDFYMNGGVIQPGCVTASSNDYQKAFDNWNWDFDTPEFQVLFVDPFACSHQRAPQYFAESILSEKGFWGWACSSYISYLLGFCPPTNYQVLAGEYCKEDTREGMYLITTNSQSPFATGKWTDLGQPGVWKLKSPLLGNREPFQNLIDEWGKLDGDFNYKMQNLQKYSVLDSNNKFSFEKFFGVAQNIAQSMATPDPSDTKPTGLNIKASNNIANSYNLNSNSLAEGNQLLEEAPKKGSIINYDELLRRTQIGRNYLNKKKQAAKINDQTDLSSALLHSRFIEEYKKNLTMNGNINPEVFQLPVFLDN